MRLLDSGSSVKSIFKRFEWQVPAGGFELLYDRKNEVYECFVGESTKL